MEQPNRGPRMSYEIFISYAHPDKSIADAVCATLEQQGIRCWIAPRDIEPGADWGLSIIEAIKSCRAIVLVFSAAANSSPQILREVERAIHLGIPVIPVRIEDVLPAGALEYHLGTVHWLDAMTPPLEAHLHRLSEALLIILNREGKAPVPPSMPVPSEAGSGSPRTVPPPPPEAAPLALEREPRSPAQLSTASASWHLSTPARLFVVLALLAAIVAGAALAYQKWFKVIDPVLVRTLTGHAAWVNSVAFTPDGKELASASNDNSVKLWDVATGQQIRTLAGHDAIVCCVAVSPDGRYLASADIEGAIKVWDLGTGQEATQLLGVITGQNKGVDALAFSPDSRRLASGNDDQTVRVWDVVDGEPKQTIATGQPGYIGAVAYSPDGRWIVSGSGASSVKVWDAATAQEVHALPAAGDVHSVAFSPGGHLLAVGSYGETVELWDIATWQKIRTLSGNTSYVHSVAFSPDGRWLISGAHDNAVQVWKVSTGRLIKTLTDHQGIVFSVAFSPDGRYFASGSGDNTIKLWSTTGGNK